MNLCIALSGAPCQHVFFSPPPDDFVVHNRFDVSRPCQWRGLGPAQRWNIELYASQTNGPGYFLWRAQCDGIGLHSSLHYENISVLHQASYEQIGVDLVLCFHLNRLFSVFSFTPSLPAAF